MIFKDKLCQKVLDGTKTQTRRLMKNDEYVWVGSNTSIVEVCDSNNRLKWHVGNTYAVQPGRGKRAVGRILLTKIGRGFIQNISPADIIAEGISTTLRGYAAETHLYSQFRELWDSIHPKGKRWKDNPEVWVLEFELVS